ncbi:AAA family ATPase [Sporosarcina sp. FSL K6-1522]|uniref:AAA family ATPase n=1 Tax=Sporosarcina sp. FSL K6-1522 TaxID=2921554 RepID=UPI00315AC2D1
MKIEKLLIYGFGQHENITVELGQGMTVLYGLNEAGKTTIQQFILHILFGFPQKNNALLRYEPKSGGKYGGQVHVYDETFGRCIVERVRGKSAGDVTVYFEDGTRGGEEALNNLLRQYNRASFESIFSFSLLQLQGFERMDEEELSRTLLASGTTGVDSLLQLEKQMEKEMGELFKKSGRNPEMNVKIAELRDLEMELKNEQTKVAEYVPAIERIQQIDGRLTALREQGKSLQEEIQRLALIRQSLPLHHKKQLLENQLMDLRVGEFPADGIRRYETLAGKHTEAEVAKRRMTEELSELASRLPEREEGERLAQLESLLAKESEWHNWRTAMTTADEEQRRLTGIKMRLFDRLGISGEAHEMALIQADVSLRQEEQMHELLAGLTECDRQISFAERQLVQIEQDLLETENALSNIERTAPSVADRERAEEWPAIRQRLAEAKAYLAFGGRAGNQQALDLPLILFLLAIAFIVFGFLQQEWFVAIAGVIVGGVGIFLYLKKEVGPSNESTMREMEKVVAAYDGQERQMEELMQRMDVYKRKREELRETFSLYEEKYRVAEATLNQTHHERQQMEAELTQFLQRYGFDGFPSPTIIPELFRMIREVQEVVRDVEDSKSRQQTARHAIDKRMVQAEQALQKMVPEEAMYEMLRREFMQLGEHAEAVKSLTGQMERLEAAVKEKASLVESLHIQVQTLWAEAGVETEEGFYHAFDAHQQQRLLTEQLDAISEQFAMHPAIEVPADVSEDRLVAQISTNEEVRVAIDGELTMLTDEKAALVHKTEHLLTDETLSAKRQLFEMKKAELAELAKKWSARKALAEAIRRTMAELKEKKLPEVLRAAEKMFSELTAGKYESLVVTEAGRFEVVSAEGLRYPIGELSQATKEQAYISLRLSLAASVMETAPFPIIMDDPFVHFDSERLSRMINVLDKLQHQHQFLYFTCHETIKTQWTHAAIIQVSDIGNG